VLTADSRLVIATGHEAVEVEEVQAAGKERMNAADWIRGRGIVVGRRFS
jgi:methionyl-tRNA formyltransferase